MALTAQQVADLRAIDRNADVPLERLFDLVDLEIADYEDRGDYGLVFWVTEYGRDLLAKETGNE